MDNKIIELMDKEPNVRITNGDKWLVRDIMAGGFVVYERNYGKRKSTALYEGDNLEDALRYLAGDF